MLECSIHHLVGNELFIPVGQPPTVVGRCLLNLADEVQLFLATGIKCETVCHGFATVLLLLLADYKVVIVPIQIVKFVEQLLLVFDIYCSIDFRLWQD